MGRNDIDENYNEVRSDSQGYGVFVNASFRVCHC